MKNKTPLYLMICVAAVQRAFKICSGRCKQQLLILYGYSVTYYKNNTRSL